MAGLGASFSMENNNEFFFTAARTMLEATSRCFSSLVKKLLQCAHTSPDPESPSAEVNAYVTAPVWHARTTRKRILEALGDATHISECSCLMLSRTAAGFSHDAYYAGMFRLLPWYLPCLFYLVLTV